MEVKEKIIEVAERNGWGVYVSQTTSSPIIQFDFSKYSDAGQDFHVSADMVNGDIYTLLDNIKNYYDGFDPDEEAMLWAGPDGHGKNGAPYRLADIVKDMEQCEEMIYELWEALSAEDWEEE